MRILYLRTQFWFGLKAGGSVAHTAGVINSLSKNHEMQVISNDELPGVNTGVELIRPKLRKGVPSYLAEIIYNFQLLFSFGSREKPDCIYHRYSGGSFAAAWLAKRWRIPLILEHNGSIIWQLRNYTDNQKGIRRFLNRINNLPKLFLFRIIERYNVYAASLITCVSEPIRNSLMEEYNIPGEKILVNPNGVDTDLYSPAADAGGIRRKYDVGDSDTLIGFIGTFGPWHGVFVLADAICLLFDSHPEFRDHVRFMLMGEGELLKPIKTELEKSGCSGKVIFTGTVPQLQAPAHLNACDILVSPNVPNPDGSAYFFSPIKLYEYMAVGKAIIASDLAQIGELLNDDEDALLAEPGEANDLAEKIADLVLDPDKREKLGKNARAKAVRSHTWDVHTKNILEALPL